MQNLLFELFKPLAFTSSVSKLYTSIDLPIHRQSRLGNSPGSEKGMKSHQFTTRKKLKNYLSAKLQGANFERA